MKIITYNVNGIRSAMTKNLGGWINEEKPDIICLQETKADKIQIDPSEFDIMGYHQYWNSAQKRGYSGVGILSKLKPLHVEYGIGHEEFDKEGRAIRADFKDCSILNVYLPSGTTGDIRQSFKLTALEYFHNYVKDLLLQFPNLIIVGDYNIAHAEDDIHDPIRNRLSSGFTMEERSWMTNFLSSNQLIDSWRHHHPKKIKYSWWTFRAGARQNNKGWRIDYILVSNPLKNDIMDVDMLNSVKHSDHCPVMLEIEDRYFKP